MQEYCYCSFSSVIAAGGEQWLPTAPPLFGQPVSAVLAIYNGDQEVVSGE